MSINASFNSAAATYDSASTIQDHCFDRLMTKLSDKYPTRIIDIGCGTGKHTLRMAQHFPKAQILAIDSSEAMIAFASHNHAHPQITYAHKAFELSDCHDVDLVFSNATFQWFDSPKQTLLDITALPQAPTLAVSFFVKNTYKELLTFFPHADIPASHFLDTSELPVDPNTWTSFRSESHLLFPSLRALFLHMRHTGVQGSQGLSIPPSQFRALDKHFLATYGQYTLTYDSIYYIS